MNALIDALAPYTPWALALIAFWGPIAVYLRLGRTGDPADREHDDLIDEWWTLRTGQLPHELPGGEL